MKRAIPTAMLGALLAAPLFAGSADDDLQAVKRALAASHAQRAERPPAEAPATAEPAPHRGSEMVWFRVRVKDKGRKGGSFSLNLPIGLARAFADDWPLDSRDGCRRHSRCRVTLGEILKSLDSGQSLVDIEDDDASVRVWVE